jgi:hypothetical protein
LIIERHALANQEGCIERHILGGQLWGSEKQKHAGSCCTPPKQKQKEEEKGKQK